MGFEVEPQNIFLMSRRGPFIPISKPGPLKLQIDLDSIITQLDTPQLTEAVRAVQRRLPGIDDTFVKNQIREHIGDTAYIESFVQKYTSADYPKTPQITKWTPPHSKDFEKDRFATSPEYQRLCKYYLAAAYPYLPDAVITTILAANNNQLTPTVRTLQELTFVEGPQGKIQADIDGTKYDVVPENQQAAREKYMEEHPIDPSTDPLFQEEVVFLEFNEREGVRIQETKLNSSLRTHMSNQFDIPVYRCIQCDCTFPQSELVLPSCGLHPKKKRLPTHEDDQAAADNAAPVAASPPPEDDGEPEPPHYLCKTCFLQDLEHTAVDTDPVMHCVRPGCGAEFSLELIRNTLGELNFNRYMERIRIDYLQTVKPEGWVVCRRCSLRMPVSDPPPPVLVCANPQCQHVFCSECGKDDHWGQPCPNKRDAKMEEFIEAVNKAMTAVTVRECPHCGFPQLRSKGCNRIECAKCHKNFCYLCRAKLPDTYPECYAHFRIEKICELWPPNRSAEAGRKQDEAEAHKAGVKAAKEWKRANPMFKDFTLPPGIGIRPEEITV